MNVAHMSVCLSLSHTVSCQHESVLGNVEKVCLICVQLLAWVCPVQKVLLWLCQWCHMVSVSDVTGDRELLAGTGTTQSPAAV